MRSFLRCRRTWVLCTILPNAAYVIFYRGLKRRPVRKPRVITNFLSQLYANLLSRKLAGKIKQVRLKHPARGVGVCRRTIYMSPYRDTCRENARFRTGKGD